MSRQTAFPGILVDNIRVQKPPFDKKGVVQEFVGRGATIEFDNLPMDGDPTPEFIKEKVRNLEDMIGPLRDTFKVEYNLLVRCTPGPDVPIADVRGRLVRAKARAWTRAKNPFEPEIIEVGEPQIDSGLTDESAFADIHRISVTVTK